MKTKSYPKIILIILIAALAVYLLFGKIFIKKQPESAIKGGPLPKEQTVTLTDSGFVPNKITISAGTAVRWVNKSKKESSSVNSDDYPTNRLYPELNLGKFGKGSTLVHIFTKSGRYSYHNHFEPDEKGTVIVE